MKRRSFIQSTAIATVASGLQPWFNQSLDKTHVLTFSFDDGFKKSFYKIAEIHEAYGLSACLNVIATGHMPDFKAIDDWIRPELMGDFNDWNKLKGRGHEVMPHTWKHLNLTKISLDHAKENIDKCLDYFSSNLDGYKDEESIFNYAFLASTPEIDEYALKRVGAVRTGAWLVMKDTKVNMIPQTSRNITFGAWANGPDNIDDYVDQTVNDFLEGPGGWMVVCLHGLDNEGWGPVSASFFDQLLKRLVKVDKLSILPAGEVIKMA